MYARYTRKSRNRLFCGHESWKAVHFIPVTENVRAKPWAQNLNISFLPVNFRELLYYFLRHLFSCRTFYLYSFSLFLSLKIYAYSHSPLFFPIAVSTFNGIPVFSRLHFCIRYSFNSMESLMDFPSKNWIELWFTLRDKSAVFCCDAVKKKRIFLKDSWRPFCWDSGKK